MKWTKDGVDAQHVDVKVDDGKPSIENDLDYASMSWPSFLFESSSAYLRVVYEVKNDYILLFVIKGLNALVHIHLDTPATEENGKQRRSKSS